MILRAGLLLFCFFAASCAGPGVAPGSAERGFIVWGFVGQGTTTPAAGQQVTLVNAAGQPVQAVTSDGAGKYVFAYHGPGNYTVRVGQVAMPVMIGAEDQRLDIDLSKPTGEMSYFAGAVEEAAKNAGPITCGAAPAPTAAPAPGATPGAAPGGAPAGAPAEQRDPNLAGNWSRSETINGGSAFVATQMSLLICADGTYARKAGETVGGGAYWHYESGSGSDKVTRGRWRTEGNIVYIDSGMGWEPYARYYIEGNSLMFTFQNGNREVWSR